MKPVGLARGSILVALLAGILLVVGPAACGQNPPPSPTPDLSPDLRDAVGAEGIMGHARSLQAIADEHGGNRAAGTPGYDASADYVADELRRAGYDVEVQRFEFPASAAVRGSELALRGAADGQEYWSEVDFSVMEYSGSGKVEAPARAVDAESSTSGCEMEDFADLSEGDVALLRRGTCTFETKAENAESAGASAALVFNAGEPDNEVLHGSLGESGISIPVIGTSGRVGEELLAREGAAEVRVFVGTGAGNETLNVIAETPGGDEDGTVMVGAHLDSVPEGPGINDNGSGSATVLEIAVQLAELDAEPRNRVRFAFWGAEELGLVGSRHYVEELDDEELEDISAYLNLDMVGSPNFVRSVYEGPDEIEDVFDAYFESAGMEVDTTSALDGRSDHGPFAGRGVPTGGLFTGAGGEKTADQALTFGGEEGAPFDACYHQACDDIGNLNREVLDQLSDAAAHVTAVLADGREG